MVPCKAAGAKGYLWMAGVASLACAYVRAVLSPCFTLASPRCFLQVLACACVGRAMPRLDVGGALRFGQWGRACQLTCRLLGEGRLDPAKA